MSILNNQSNQVTKKLHEIKLSDFLKGQSVVTVNYNDTIDTAIMLLNKHNIHSCPVEDNGSCVGVVDMLAIMRHILLVCPSEDYNKPYNLEVAGRAIALKKVGDLLEEQEVPFVALEVNEFANLALDVFSSGIHRTPVLDSEGKVVETISQSDFVKWIYDQSNTYLKKFDVFDKKVMDLGLSQKVVTSVKSTDTVIKSIWTLVYNNLSAVPIVNDNGDLVGNFSATDLKVLCQENWPSFFVPVLDYLKEHSPNSVSTLGLPQNLTLRDALGYLNDHNYHRVWVLNGKAPVGVVSHTDLMKFFQEYAESPNFEESVLATE